MRISKYFLFTLKNISSKIKITSHKLMLKAGLIRKLTLGSYTWLPTGLRVIKKIKKIIRNKMKYNNSIEISMPIMQPSKLWKKSKRLNKYNLELFKFKDRNNKKLILSPTNEEVITNLISNEIKSYKELPLIFYQIQNKFRDELRPKSGILRSREFLMKDAYSFHLNKKSLKKTYKIMYKIYNSIFNKIGLKFKVVKADNGNIGGNISHEFQVLTKNGEEKIVISNNSSYSSKIENAERKIKKNIKLKPKKKLILFDKNNKKLYLFYKKNIKNTVKIIIVHTKKNINYPFLGIILRGDHKLNKIKLEKIPEILIPITFANKKEIKSNLGISKTKYIGPINLSIPFIIDYSVSKMNDFISGANIKKKFFYGINWHRDLTMPKIYSLREVKNGDISPDGKGILKIKKGIEVGHIFQIGKKYSKSIKSFVINKKGKKKKLIMGCYGIGISRLISAVIEQNHDKRGIIWPIEISPFHLAIIPINIKKSNFVKKISKNIYIKIKKKIDVLFYDKIERPGIMFYNIDLIGIPHILIISEKNLKKNKIEYKSRKTGKIKFIKINKLLNFLFLKIFKNI